MPSAHCGMARASGPSVLLQHLGSKCDPDKQVQELGLGASGRVAEVRHVTVHTFPAYVSLALVLHRKPAGDGWMDVFQMAGAVPQCMRALPSPSASDLALSEPEEMGITGGRPLDCITDSCVFWYIVVFSILFLYLNMQYFFCTVPSQEGMHNALFKNFFFFFLVW
ncbi:UNVERIFIED_CONTAM: hypothetical protein K2H54_003771 [Gekko kuhli]